MILCNKKLNSQIKLKFVSYNFYLNILKLKFKIEIFLTYFIILLLFETLIHHLL